MNKLLLLLTLLLPTAPAGAAPSESESLAQALESEKPAEICRSGTDTFRTSLDRAWRHGAGFFVKACNANPKGPSLFPGDAQAKMRAKAYCDFRPAVRLCMVCGMLTKTAKDLGAAFEACREFFRPAEAEAFARKVLSTSPASAAPPPAASPAATESNLPAN